MNLDAGGSARATTTHKTKPDGSREVSHTVEQKSASAMLQRTKPRQTAEKPQMPHHKEVSVGRSSDKLHHAIIARAMGNVGGGDERSLAETLQMLRSIRLNSLAGDGRLERPAPLDGAMQWGDGTNGMLGSGGAGGAATVSPQDFPGAWDAQHPGHSLIPRYKGGLLPPRGNA